MNAKTLLQFNLTINQASNSGGAHTPTRPHEKAGERRISGAHFKKEMTRNLMTWNERRRINAPPHPDVREKRGGELRVNLVWYTFAVTLAPSGQDMDVLQQEKV